MSDFPPPGGFQPPGGQQPPPPGAPPPPAPTAATPYAPSGYQPGWTTPAASAQPHKSLKGIATALTVALLLAALASIVAGIAFLNRASFVDDVNRLNLSDAEAKDDAVRSGIGFFFLMFVIVGVLWLIGQFRHAKNAERLRGSLGLGPGWAIGGWFIPFGNFVLPGMQLHQAAKASDPDLPPGRPWKEGRSQALVLVWALVFDLSALCFSIGSSTRPSTDELVLGTKDFSDFANADRAAAFGMFGYALAAVIAVFMVRTLAERQERAAATIAPSAPAAPVYMPPAQPQYPQQPYPPQQPAPPAWGQPQPPPPNAPPPTAPPPTAPPPTAPPPPPGQWGPPPTQ
jgi:hypothetical protein